MLIAGPRARAAERELGLPRSAAGQVFLALLLSAGLLVTDHAAAQGVRSVAPSVGALIALALLALGHMTLVDVAGVAALVAATMTLVPIAFVVRRRHGNFLRAFRRQVASVQPNSHVIPTGLDVESLLAAAQAQFLRLQSAWDRSDLEALRRMTTPQMCQSLIEQMPQHGEPANCTEFLEVRATMFAFEVVAGAYLASIEFSGLVRESPWTQPVPFKELWLLVPSQSGDERWLLAGQQVLF